MSDFRCKHGTPASQICAECLKEAGIECITEGDVRFLERQMARDRDAAIRALGRTTIPAGCLPSEQDERQRLKDAVAVLTHQRDEARSQLREAQERELALRDDLDEIVNYQGGAVNPLEDDYLMDRCQQALSNTSATAQQTVARIEREALEKIVKGILDNFVYGCRDRDLPEMIRRGAEVGLGLHRQASIVQKVGGA